MERIEINVQTGERKVIQLTPEEVAAAQSASDNDVPVVIKTLTDQILSNPTELAKLKAALGLS